MQPWSQLSVPRAHSSTSTHAPLPSSTRPARQAHRYSSAPSDTQTRSASSQEPASGAPLQSLSTVSHISGAPGYVASLASSQSVGTLVFGAALLPLGWQPPTPSAFGLFMLMGAISVGALLCINRSLKLAPASVVVPYQYTMIVWAVMFGYLVFGDTPQPMTLLGAAIIIAAGIYIFLREQALGRNGDAVNPPA